MSKAQSVGELFDRMGGIAAVGRLLGKRPSTASEMKRSGYIHVKHWPALINSPPGRSIGLDADGLMRACLKGRGK